MRRKIAIGAAVSVAVYVLGIAPALAGFPEDCFGSQTRVTLTSGYDNWTGGSADQCVDALGGSDDLFAGGGDDSLFGESGGDQLQGQAGDDNLWGNAGDDTLVGGGGADVLQGGNDDDVMFDGVNPSGTGDHVYGGAGFDALYHCTGTGSNSGQDFISSDVEYVYPITDC